ncbi:RNA polymerase sigma-70 factor [Paraflavitalea sp. CAU 1676]|uniref:RNA polymerase sigma factor n=1 Tax=Paraflavitalea sp. CAU 1676 TaxID=3032598 RepID=UPI0023D97B09|nr:RNA polymerase sigma-70 factor [Paraflavitalea sp. CAU 1676]MDF2187790.1 RNA polymerase sigma-70 factor [Paraflavitalea sp. CAU 1676]
MPETLYHTEKELLNLVAKGNELAFRRIFDLYNKRLFTFAEGMLKSAADAEEIVQDCFTKVWLNRESLQVVENPGSYLYKIVRNSTIDHLRKTAREQNLINQVWANISHSDNSLEEEILKNDSQQLIAQALAQLSEQKQQVFRLSRESGLSHEAIASIMGLSKSRVNNILVESIRHIKNHLDKHSYHIGMVFWLWAWEQLL